MKKKIIIAVSVTCLLAFIGAAVLVAMISHSTLNFNKLIKLHQVEILRQHLLLDIRRVEADLYSQSTERPESSDAVKKHVLDMENTAKSCFGCHHAESVLRRFRELNRQVDQYGHAATRAMARQGSARGREEAQKQANIISESLADTLNTMIVLTTKRLNEQTERTFHDEQLTEMLLIIVVVAGLLLLVALGVVATRSLTKPITVLLDATRKLQGGELNYRIVGLRDEFAELAVAFNDMALSLKEHVRAIEESEARYRHLFESAADAIYLLDVEQPGRILQVNQAAATMHGYSVQELMTMNIQDLLTPDSALGLSVRIERILAGQWVRAEVNHRRKDGSTFPVEIGAGLFDAGTHKWILAIDRDISARKLAEEALQRAQQIRVSGELATGIAHEIKNPLAGIKLTIQMLLEEKCLSTDNRVVIHKMIAEIKRIEYLMKGLLKFAKPPQPQLAATDVNAVLETVTRLVLCDRECLREGPRAIRVVKDLAERLPEILADPMQLQQVFMNLLLNAVEAMPEGGVITLTTSFDRALDAVQIDISDTGSGINASAMNQLFTPFFTTKPRGTGLGLAITKRLVEAHGGGIRIENNRESGATVKISLPSMAEKRMTAS